MQYLQHTGLTPKEIGFILGYGSVSNFRRAFKAWTGHKLSEFRESRVLVERIVVHHPAS